MRQNRLLLEIFLGWGSVPVSSSGLEASIGPVWDMREVRVGEGVGGRAAGGGDGGGSEQRQVTHPRPPVPRQSAFLFPPLRAQLIMFFLLCGCCEGAPGRNGAKFILVRTGNHQQ